MSQYPAVVIIPVMAPRCSRAALRRYRSRSLAGARNQKIGAYLIRGEPEPHSRSLLDAKRPVRQEPQRLPLADFDGQDANTSLRPGIGRAHPTHTHTALLAGQTD